MIMKSRSNTRIAPIMAKISHLWYQFPDLRFGQIAAIIEGGCQKHGYNSSFYVEEERLSEILDEIIEEMTSP